MTTAPPTPPRTDAAAFVAALRRLKAWSGLSYRTLERRAADAGHSLPYSTAATMLGRERLPREELVAAFVAACGIRGSEAEAWLDARTDIACGPVPEAAAPTGAVSTGTAPVINAPVVAAPARTRSRRTRWTLAVAAALVTALLGGATASGAFTDDEEKVLETPASARL